MHLKQSPYNIFLNVCLLPTNLTWPPFHSFFSNSQIFGYFLQLVLTLLSLIIYTYAHKPFIHYRMGYTWDGHCSSKLNLNSNSLLGPRSHCNGALRIVVPPSPRQCIIRKPLHALIATYTYERHMCNTQRRKCYWPHMASGTSLIAANAKHAYKVNQQNSMSTNFNFSSS